MNGLSLFLNDEPFNKQLQALCLTHPEPQGKGREDAEDESPEVALRARADFIAAQPNCFQEIEDSEEAKRLIDLLLQDFNLTRVLDIVRFSSLADDLLRYIAASFSQGGQTRKFQEALLDIPTNRWRLSSSFFQELLGAAASDFPAPDFSRRGDSRSLATKRLIRWHILLSNFPKAFAIFLKNFKAGTFLESTNSHLLYEIFEGMVRHRLMDQIEEEVHFVWLKDRTFSRTDRSLAREFRLKKATVANDWTETYTSSGIRLMKMLAHFRALQRAKKSPSSTKA